MRTETYCTEMVAANGTGQRGKLEGKSPAI
jgi:hypothetical protein